MGVAPLGVFVILRVLLKGSRGQVCVPLEPISYLYNTHPLLQSGCLCVLRTLCTAILRSLVDSPRARTRARARARTHTPSFSFARNGALSAFRTLVLAWLCERNAGPLLCRETMSTRDRRTTRHKRENRLFRFAGSRGKTSSFYSFPFLFFFHLLSLFRSVFFLFLVFVSALSVEGRVSMGVLERAWEKSALLEIFEKLGASRTTRRGVSKVTRWAHIPDIDSTELLFAFVE